jgi:mannose-6-phosphate isomerase-like protein (cupin superfamily)
MSVSAVLLNIQEWTLLNHDYRRVMFTGTYQQTVLMSLLPGEDIPVETHEGDQFIRVQAGVITIVVNGERLELHDGDAINVPSGAEHYVRNTGTVPAKLYTVYAPPQHAAGLIQSKRV